MLLLGHAGITLGVATLLTGAVKSHASQSWGVSWFTYLESCIDIRLLLVGSLLPDIIDKPVGQVFFQETFNNGRIFSHTLIFLIIIAAAGYCLYKYHRKKIWLLTLAAGTFMHLVLDEMWFAPGTLFWPFLGFAFEKVDLTGWVLNIFQALMSAPGVYIPEAVGLVVLLWFMVALAARKKVGAFLKYGKVN